MKMLTWQFGIQTNFKRNPGKYGQHFPEVLSLNQWDQFLRTVTSAGIHQTWEALFTMNSLFRDSAKSLQNHFDFDDATKGDERFSAYLYHIHEVETFSGG